MTECEHLARTSAYFDGALDPADEHAAAAHLATCAECQALLGDAVGIDAALADARRPAPVRARRWQLVVAGLAVAAGIALVVAWPRHHAPDLDRLALGPTRAVEARFTGPAFVDHRPRAAARSATQPTEPVPLAALARLERAGDTRDLVAALASSGDLRRAAQLAARLPDDASSASDRAALALAAGDPETALGHAQRALELAAGLAPARWNLALAAARLGLYRVARAGFAAVAASGERGWSTEAGERAEALVHQLAVEDGYDDLDARAKAMIGGGAPLTADDVARYPARARIAFFDAARLAPDAARFAALRPLAVALDRASGTRTATAALERIDPAVTARYADAYRAVLARTATPAEATRFIAELEAAGPGADDMRVGAIILAGQAAQRLADLRAITASWNDPWFTYFIEREQLHVQYVPGDAREVAPLRDALAACTGDAWALRCGQLAFDLAELEISIGHDPAAEVAAQRAVALYRTAMSQVLLARARALVADLHRLQGRTALARAELEDVVLAARGRDCDGARYAGVAQAEMAIVDGDWAAARTALPPATPGEGCSGAVDLLGVAVAIDLARATGDRGDVSTARAWLAAAGDLAEGGIAVLGALRLGTGDPAAARAWIAAHATPTDRDLAAVRAWGVTTLIRRRGRARGDWAGVVAEAAPPPAPCVVVASSDDDRVTVAVKTPDGIAGEHRRVPVHAQAQQRLISAALAARLARCADIAVVARPPLHGRSDLLPPELPWWFAGDAPPRAAAPVPARSLEVTSAVPPDPALPAIDLAPTTQPFDVRLAGPTATPANVLAAMKTATYVELDVHGITAAQDAGAAYLALSPRSDGTFALRADEVARARLAAHPVIVLAACHAARVAPYLRERWSLPDAFVTAGATAVIAADVAIPDPEARPVLDELHRRIAAGEPVASAVAAVRAHATSGWVTHLMVFR